MRIQEHTELEVYKKAFDAAMRIFELTVSERGDLLAHGSDTAFFSIYLCQFGRSMAQAPI